MRSDRELLELAARAAGLRIDKSTTTGGGSENAGFDVCGNAVLDWHSGVTWNPLTDDGAALRLAVKLGLDFYEGDDDGRAAYAGYYEPRGNTRRQKFCIERHDANPDAFAATRRAIVRAAAALASISILTGDPS